MEFSKTASLNWGGVCVFDAAPRGNQFW